METWHIYGLVVSAIQVGLTIWILLLVHEMRDGSRAALQNVQIQLAFLSGRVGLNNKDLQSAAIRATDTEPPPPPEVIGGTEWNDFEETVDRIARGEIETEETRRAG